MRRRLLTRVHVEHLHGGEHDSQVELKWLELDPVAGEAVGEDADGDDLRRGRGGLLPCIVSGVLRLRSWISSSAHTIHIECVDATAANLGISSIQTLLWCLREPRIGTIMKDSGVFRRGGSGQGRQQ